MIEKKDQETLESIRISRVILPVFIGITVVIYLLWKQFDPAAFYNLKWTSRLWFWLGMALFFLVVRHLSYATRLRILSQGAFSWKKSIELIFIWEFSSAVSPTSVGGSAVALFALSQEKIGPAKTAAIVLYTVVVDTFFFISSLPILLYFFGPKMIRPDLSFDGSLDGWFLTFVLAYSFMFLYGCFFFYGLFINPRRLKVWILSLTSISILKKYKDRWEKIGNDFIAASAELKMRKIGFHVGVFSSTAIAWSMRFLLLNCLIIGLVSTASTSLFDQGQLFARLESMFVIMAFSPTPGGAGFAEIVFQGFLSDYVPEGISVIIAFLWRLLTYYTYLVAGAIIVPNWIRNVLNRRRIEKGH